MKSRRRPVHVVACTLAVLIASASRAGGAPDGAGAATGGGAAVERGARAPLTNEEVVRLVMTGTPEQAILDRIARQPADFDLSPDVVQEMKNAGVGERVLEAMRRRQAEMPRREPAPTPTPVPANAGTIEIAFVPDPQAKTEAERSVIALRELPPRVRRRGGMEVGEVIDLALAVLCTTADHVPDHWDTRTPLGSDAPRHELLFFQPGSAEATLKGFKVLYLKHEAAYRVSVPEGRHDIVVAVAGQQRGSRAWRLLAADAAQVSIRPDRTTRLTVAAHSGIRGSAMIGYGLDVEWKVAAAGGPDEAPPARAGNGP